MPPVKVILKLVWFARERRLAHHMHEGAREPLQTSLLLRQVKSIVDIKMRHLPTLHCTVIGLTRKRFVAIGLPSWMHLRTRYWDVFTLQRIQRFPSCDWPTAVVPKLVRTVTQIKVVIMSYHPLFFFCISGQKFLLQWSLIIQTNIVILVPRLAHWRIAY